MTPEEYVEKIESLFAECLTVLKQKGADYTDGVDPLHNFKTVAKDANISPLKAWYVYAYKHWSALKAYVKNGKVESEPIRGRIIDLINYAAILHMLIEDQEQGCPPLLVTLNQAPPGGRTVALGGGDEVSGQELDRIIDTAIKKT